jgi:hypothetical protein
MIPGSFVAVSSKLTAAYEQACMELPVMKLFVMIAIINPHQALLIDKVRSCGHVLTVANRISEDAEMRI